MGTVIQIFSGSFDEARLELDTVREGHGSTCTGVYIGVKSVAGTEWVVVDGPSACRIAHRLLELADTVMEPAE